MSKKSTYKIPFFEVPYPPELTVEEILIGRPEAKLKSRAPNRYLIYRIAVLKELRKRTNENVPMTKISAQISQMWFNEPAKVKDAYKKLSDQVEDRLREIRQKEKLVIVPEFPELQESQDHSPSEKIGGNPNYIPILSDPSYQLCGPPPLFQYPLLPQHPSPSEINLAINQSYVPILYFDPSYRQSVFFTPVDEYRQIDHAINSDFDTYFYESCLCEVCASMKIIK
jgi:hypothetical protein